METMDTSSTDSKELTFGMLARVLKLSKLQIKAVLNLIQFLPPPEDEVLAPKKLRYLLLADLLENIRFLRAEQRAAILGDVWKTKLNGTDIPDCCLGDQVVFADSRYCTWSGNVGWLDLETGDLTETLPCPPLETIAYNLVELERQARQAIENRSGGNAKQHSAGSMEESGYVRVGSADAVSG